MILYTCMCMCYIRIYMYRSNDSFHPFMPPPSLVGVHRHKPQGVDDQWQRPEMSSNVAVELSLADTIDALLLPSDIERRSKKWKDAHCKYTMCPPAVHRNETTSINSYMCIIIITYYFKLYNYCCASGFFIF